MRITHCSGTSAAIHVTTSQESRSDAQLGQLEWKHKAQSNTPELLRIFLFGLPDDEPSHISVAVFCAVDDFLKSCNRFW